MPSFIPNQPITFSGLDQPCLNNDNSRYSMLSQGCERWKLQIQNSPCGSEDGSVCDPQINALGDIIVSSQFQNAAEWTTNNANIFPAFGRAVLFVDHGAGTPDGLIKKNIALSTPDSFAYRTVKVRYKITQVDGNGTLYFQTDDGFNYATLAQVVNPQVSADYYEFYAQIDWQATHFNIGIICPNPDDFTVTLTEVQVQYIAPCWQMIGSSNGLAGESGITTFAWTYSQIAGQGFFTAPPGWDIFSSATFPTATLYVDLVEGLTAGDIISVSYQVTGRTTGYVYAQCGGTAGTGVTANGIFTEDITLGADATFLEFYVDETFDGTISLVKVLNVPTCHTFDIVDIVTGMDVVSGIAPEYVNDKIQLNINPCSIPYYVGEELNDWELQDGCYQIRFNNCCDDTSVLSDTVISYKRTDEHDCSVLVEAYCDGRALGFDFTGGFTLLQRLRVLLFSPFQKKTGNVSTDGNGRKRKTFARSETIYKVLFDYCDAPTHAAISTQLDCDTLTLDGEEYSAIPDDYEPNWSPRGRRNLAQSEIELQKVKSVIYNRNTL